MHRIVSLLFFFGSRGFVGGRVVRRRPIGHACRAALFSKKGRVGIFVRRFFCHFRKVEIPLFFLLWCLLIQRDA